MAAQLAETRSAKPAPGFADADQEFLDGAFALLLDAAEEGQDRPLEDLLSQRPDLSPAIHSLAELAKSVAVAPRPDDPPLHLPGYTIVSQIGAGGMGRVYLAHQESAARRPVAVKVLPAAYGFSVGRERLKREAEAISSLQHKHIVPVFDVVRTTDSNALVMEFVEGGSLQNLIEALGSSGDRFRLAAASEQVSQVSEALGAAPARPIATDYPRLIARIGIQIADALHTVHAGKLLHRDVKPSNVLLRRDGTGLLSDFGLVQEVRDRTVTTQVGFAGTPAYSSPEQLRGIDRLDPRSDIYSLGATLFHALTFRRPYAGDSAVQVLHSIEHTARGTVPRLRPPAGARSLPRDLETIVRKAMEPDRTLRYATASDLASDLARFLEDRPIRARPPSLWTHGLKFVRRNRRAVWTGALVALLVSLIAAGLLFRATVLPEWSAVSLLSARSGLLGSSHLGHVFNFGFWEFTGDPRRPVAQRPGSDQEAARFARALTDYDRSITLGDWSAATAAERDAVAILVARFTGRSELVLEPVGTDVASHLQWLTGAAPSDSEFRSREERVSPVASRVADLPTRDLRQIGLISFVLADVGTAIAAWKQLENRGEDDAFAAGVLGTLYLIEESPALAYARLQRAVIAYPAFASFLVGAADAALSCGDTTKGVQFLELARRAPNADAFALTRLDSLVRFDQGEVDAVHAEVVRAFSHHPKPIPVTPYLAYQLARRAQSIGRTDLFFEMSALACAASPAPKRALRLFVPLAQRHWNHADESERRTIIIEWATCYGRIATWRSTLPFALHQASFSIPESLADPASLRALVDGADTRLHGLFGFTNGSPDYSCIADLGEPLRTQVADWLLTGEGTFPDEAATVLRAKCRELLKR